MAKITEYQNSSGEDCLLIDNEDGTTTSMSKAHYEELEAAKNDAKQSERLDGIKSQSRNRH